MFLPIYGVTVYLPVFCFSEVITEWQFVAVEKRKPDS